jgi:thioredoxin reductase
MLHDAIIVGGSFAGLSAALQLARARRKVLVIDAGLPRNRFASESHGVLGHDGKPGSQVLAEARQQLQAYPTVQIFNGRVSRVDSGEAGFVVEAEDGMRWFTGRRLLLATGVADVLPESPASRSAGARRWCTAPIAMVMKSAAAPSACWEPGRCRCTRRCCSPTGAR